MALPVPQHRMLALFAGGRSVDAVMEQRGEEGQRAPASVGTLATSHVSRGGRPISAHDKPLLQCGEEDYEPFQRGRFSRACRGSYGSNWTVACAELPTLGRYCRNVRQQADAGSTPADARLRRCLDGGMSLQDWRRHGNPEAASRSVRCRRLRER
jgi:hypothetical protein